MKSVLINLTFVTLSVAVLVTTFAYFNAEKIGLMPAGNAAMVSMSQDKIGQVLETAGEYVSFDKVISSVLSKIEHATSSLSATPPEEETGTEDPELTPPPQNLDEAIVNILCVQKTSKFTKKISGTGFFVSSSGAIITNAHVAQFLLLKGVKGQGTMECSASTGLDGAASYDIELLYISPTWLLENASLISEVSPKGNGEHDFALLYVTGRKDGEAATSNFAHLPPATNPLSKSMKGETVILVGYPREGGTGANTRTTATTTVRGIYTFEDGGYADVISLNDSPLGYNGASGGPVIDHLGRSLGVITTKSNSSTVLNAITMSHIDRSMKAETGHDLISVLQGDLKAKALLFNEVISPILSEILAENLD